MFQPQEITCTNCQHQGRIITEDIHAKKITVVSDDAANPRIIDVRVKCPSCEKEFVIRMERRWWTLGDDILFECVSQNNEGLQMWRKMDRGILAIPYYYPIFANRSRQDQQLDSECMRIADGFVGWRIHKTPGQSLDDILSQVEDYTKGNSWNNFYKKHIVVALCGSIKSNMIKTGFNGEFYPVNYKNADLMAAMDTILGGAPEENSKLFCNNPIGHCAEVHAANSFLFYEPKTALKALRFSIAYLIRFGEPRSYCMNCIELFDLTNA